MGFQENSVNPKDVKQFQGIPINACVFHRIMISIQFRWGPKIIPLDVNQFQLNSINSHGIESIPVEPIGNGCQVNSNGGQREWQPNSINSKGFRTIPMASNAFFVTTMENDSNSMPMVPKVNSIGIQAIPKEVDQPLWQPINACGFHWKVIPNKSPMGAKGDSFGTHLIPKGFDQFPWLPINSCGFHWKVIAHQFQVGPKGMPRKFSQPQRMSNTFKAFQSMPVYSIG